MIMVQIQKKIKIIPNFINQNKINELAIEKVDHQWLKDKYNRIPIILSAGRLDLQKDWDNPFESIQKITKKN